MTIDKVLELIAKDVHEALGNYLAGKTRHMVECEIMNSIGYDLTRMAEEQTAQAAEHADQEAEPVRFAIRRAISSSSVPIRLTTAQEMNTPSQPKLSLRYPEKNPENALPT